MFSNSSICLPCCPMLPATASWTYNGSVGECRDCWISPAIHLFIPLQCFLCSHQGQSPGQRWESLMNNVDKSGTEIHGLPIHCSPSWEVINSCQIAHSDMSDGHTCPNMTPSTQVSSEAPAGQPPLSSGHRRLALAVSHKANNKHMIDFRLSSCASRDIDIVLIA